MASSVRMIDGAWDWSQGVDSSKVTTMASQLVPNGLKRDMLAFMCNATVRGGGINCRNGINWMATIGTGNDLWQGGFVYEPDFGDPYLICSIGGRILKVLLEDPWTITDLSSISGLTNPATVDKAFFCQAEKFLVIQAGDYETATAAGTTPTLPLFWDGTTLRRSIGITNTGAPPNTPGINEIPAAMCMDYYMNRLWYAQGRTYSAGDIVGGLAGTVGNKYRDAVLNVTESPLCFGGDGFTVPSNAGNIRAISHTAAVDTPLGEGQLFVFTRKVIYKMVVPITRTDWIATTGNNLPLQTVIAKSKGTYSDTSVVGVNSDLFYQSQDGIRSLNMWIRYAGAWGNTGISANEDRVLKFNDRSLMHHSSGILFDNRMLQTALPVQTNAGVAFQGIIPLDFDLISTLQDKLPPAWEGMLEGLLWLQLFVGDFGGEERAFCTYVSEIDGSIRIAEISRYDRFDDEYVTDDNAIRRITWYAETPAFTWGKETELKQLDGGEIWVDRVFGSVTMEVEYRPDADNCWRFWHRIEVCSAESSCETVDSPICYPEQPYNENYVFPITLPKAPLPQCQTLNQRPTNIGHQFQVRITMKGWARIRGLMVYALPLDKSPFGGLACAAPGAFIPAMTRR